VCPIVVVVFESWGVFGGDTIGGDEQQASKKLTDTRPPRKSYYDVGTIQLDGKRL